MHHHRITHRVALVLDIDTADTATHLDSAARGWLRQLIEQLTQRGVTATPVRIDIDGWPVVLP